VARWLIAAVVLAGLIGAGRASGQAARPTVVELRLEGVVDPFVAGYIADEIAAANGRGADAVLLIIDTP
jgi:membrane-bound ClpP family serine protease